MRCASAALCAALAAFPLLAADSESPKRLIVLNVAATDSKGDPVTDLKSGEIRIHEDGKLRPVYFFHFDGSRRETPTPAPGEFVNRPGPPTRVILFDRWNETAMVTASSWGDLDRMLDHMETAERIYIYFLTNHGDLYVVHGLPPAGIDRALDPSMTPAQLRALLDESVNKLAGLRGIDTIDPVVSVNTTLKALVTVGSLMAPIGGRKDLIWVTHGFPLVILGADPNSGGRGRGTAADVADMLDFNPQVRALSMRALQSEVAFYTVDQSARGSGANPNGESRQTLEMLSSLTGGRWYASGEIEDAINGTSADARGNYRVAFYSEYRPKDKKEHKLRLETERKGVRLLTQEGYFGDTPEPPAAEIETTMLSACGASPFDATQIGLRGSFNKGHLTLRIEPSDILLDHAGDQYVGHLSVAFAFWAGETAGKMTKPVEIDIRLAEDAYQKALKDGLSVNQDLQFDDGTKQIRAIVYDSNLRSLGSLTIPVK